MLTLYSWKWSTDRIGYLHFVAGVLHAKVGTVVSEGGATLPTVGLQGWKRLLRLTWMKPRTIR